ncbi:MAG TPA: ABC transporter permease subunit, partial [Candidatus Saccharimonadales bacterium]|nr:ABC transporter permease subunit [Candidatus Saccharimonadales bacterium]
MNWFVWRQHRKQFLIIGIILALYAALIIPTGLHFWHTYQQTLASCAQNPATPSCSDLASNLFQSSLDQALFHLAPVAILFLPLILGMFWGAPFLAKEYTEGTNSLAWTQSVSRRKWLTVKLIWILVATAVFTGAFAALITWWSKTPNTLNTDRFTGDPLFGTQGIVPVALGLFAVTFGIMFGAWFRKTMVAVGVTLGLFIAFALIVVPNFVRPHYMTPITVTAPMGPDTLDSKIPSGAWLVSRNIVDKNGNTFNSFNLANMPPQCQQIIQQSQVGTNDHGIRVKAMPTPGGGDPIDTCLNNAGYHQIAKYQPSYRYWR